MQNQALDLVAKLLANENINVVRAPVATAAFDIVGRTLVLPQWKEMTPSIDQMLVGHEVAHALFTSTDYNDALETRLKFKRAKAFLNILEDVRIEKLMKRRYPGMRKVFNAGYRELNEMDFFEIRGRDLSSAHLMDRINLYFKVGYGVVQFSSEEKPFVVRAENLETIDETIVLAEDIHKFLKEQEAKALEQAAAAKAAAKEEEQDEADGEADENFDDEDFDGDIPEADDEDTTHSFKDLVDQDFEPSDESDETNETDGNGEETSTEEGDTDRESEDQSDQDSNEGTDGTASDLLGQKNDSQMFDSEDELEGNEEFDGEGEMPTTNAAFESRVSELADTNTEYRYWTIEPVKYDPIVPFKDVTRTVNSSYENPLSNATLENVRSFKRDTQNNVDYLVKEFEMRKAATAYKRAQTSKVGSLDMKKVWAYKLNDDIFKRVTTIKQGKNHGMVFLLDWSGSMHNVLSDTIDQVINLAMFCQRAGIAYEVFAFTDHYTTDSAQKYFDTRVIEHNTNKIDVSNNRFALLELFSNKMTQSDFNMMVNNLKSRRVERVFQLNGTPLNEALVYMYDYIEKFQKMNNVEKVSFITLTDGQGGQLPAYIEKYTYTYEGGVPKKKNFRHFVRDTFTKKNHEITNYAADQTSLLIELIKARYNCTVLGFYITRNSRRDLSDALRAHYSDMNGSTMWNTVERIKSEFRTNGYSSLMGTGRDELFIVPISSTKVQYEQLQIDSSANARSIASKFGKYMSTKKTSRILLNKFIGYVA